MSTVYVYNGFGAYDQRNGVGGTVLKFNGDEFFFPFQQVRPLPNWTFRNVDQDKSTPQGGSQGELVYMTTLLPGQVLANQLLELGIPHTAHNMGLLPITGKATGEQIEVFSGCDSDGNVIMSDVAEKEATKAEIAEAEATAKLFKEEVVKNYFQSKRERMAGGTGRLHPSLAERRYMDELNLEDLDDVSAHSKAASNGITPELIAAIIREVNAGNQVNTESLREAIATVRRAGNEPQLAKAKPKSLGLAEKAAAYDEKQKVGG